jgi:hypothetical protein
MTSTFLASVQDTLRAIIRKHGVVSNSTTDLLHAKCNFTRRDILAKKPKWYSGMLMCQQVRWWPLLLAVHALQVGCQRSMSQAGAVVLCFAGWLSECTASHTAQHNTLWSNVDSHHKVCISYCVVCSLQTLCSLQPDNQPAKHNMSTPNCVSVQRWLLWCTTQ